MPSQFLLGIIYEFRLARHWPRPLISEPVVPVSRALRANTHSSRTPTWKRPSMLPRELEGRKKCNDPWFWKNPLKGKLKSLVLVIETSKQPNKQKQHSTFYAKMVPKVKEDAPAPPTAKTLKAKKAVLKASTGRHQGHKKEDPHVTHLPTTSPRHCGSEGRLNVLRRTAPGETSLTTAPSSRSP